MQIYIPILRSDLALEETYQHRVEPPLDIPIAAFGGTMDKEAATDVLDPWAKYITSSSILKCINADNVFRN